MNPAGRLSAGFIEKSPDKCLHWDRWLKLNGNG